MRSKLSRDPVAVGGIGIVMSGLLVALALLAASGRGEEQRPYSGASCAAAVEVFLPTRFGPSSARSPA